MEQEYKYAGFWVRMVATLIDALFCMVLTWPLLFWIYGRDYFDVDKSGFIAGPADFLISWVLPSIVAITLWYYKQSTPGKMLFSLRIVDAATGGKPSLRQFIVRYFAYFVSLIPLGIGYIVVGFDKRKQGWHDKLAKTLVVKK